MLKRPETLIGASNSIWFRKFIARRWLKRLHDRSDKSGMAFDEYHLLIINYSDKLRSLRARTYRILIYTGD